MATKSNSEITTLDDSVAVVTPVATEAATIAGANHDAAMSGKQELITIHSSSDDGGTDAVFVSHNGYAYQIPRDQPFKVPRAVAQILRDAGTVSYKPGVGGAVSERMQPRFAFSSVAV